MPHIFVTHAKEPAARWIDALGTIVLRASIDGVRLSPASTFWLDLSSLESREALAFIDRIIVTDQTIPIVCMVPFPRDEEAFALMARGARGYCHVAAAASQLQLVANTVSSGGFWLPTTLMRRFMSSAGGLVSQQATRSRVSLDDLTPRETQVAQAVADGCSNREIAALLNISERTVKARLTSVFQKLDVRDRVQLALFMRGGVS